jgi:hypothetical protein
MKVRLTPLNFFSAFFIILAVYVWINGAATMGIQVHQLGGTICWIFLLFAFVVSFLDIMFRNFFPETKKIWIVELSFITLTIIIFYLLKR